MSRSDRIPRMDRKQYVTTFEVCRPAQGQEASKRGQGTSRRALNNFRLVRHSPKISGSATEFPFQNGAAGSDASQKGSYRAS